MEFLELVKTRRSIRKFKPREVGMPELEKIVLAASFAQSWKNTQTTRYIAIKNPATINALAENCVMGYENNRNIIKNAPLIIIATTVTGRSGFERDGRFSTSKETHWESLDAGIAVQTLCLAAHGEGLGSVVLGIFDEAKVQETVDIPGGQKVSAIIAMGYPDESPQAPRRKGVGDLLTVDFE